MGNINNYLKEAEEWENELPSSSKEIFEKLSEDAINAIVSLYGKDNLTENFQKYLEYSTKKVSTLVEQYKYDKEEELKIVESVNNLINKN